VKPGREWVMECTQLEGPWPRDLAAAMPAGSKLSEKIDDYEIVVEVGEAKMWMSVEPPGLYTVFEASDLADTVTGQIAERIAASLTRAVGLEVKAINVG